MTLAATRCMTQNNPEIQARPTGLIVLSLLLSLVVIVSLIFIPSKVFNSAPEFFGANAVIFIGFFVLSIAAKASKSMAFFWALLWSLSTSTIAGVASFLIHGLGPSV